MTRSIFGNRLAAVIILAVGVVIGLLGVTKNGPFIEGAKSYSQEIAKSSIKTYSSLRLINAAISFAEEVEVGGSIIAVNGSAHPFKVLEPIDDAVERLSNVIFFVGAISGVLAVFLPMLGGGALMLVGASLVALAVVDLINFRFYCRNFLIDLFQGTSRLGGLGFLVVIAFSISSWFANGVSNTAWGEYELTLTRIAEQMPDLSTDNAIIIEAGQESADEDHSGFFEPEEAEVTNEEAGLLERIGGGLRSTGEGVVSIAGSTVSSVKSLASGAVDGLKGVASITSATSQQAAKVFNVFLESSDDFISALMGVFAAFLFKTLVCPLLILAGLWRLAGSLNFMRVRR